MTALLQARNLGKAFAGHTVFESVSFEVHGGQHVALLGPSGCGKSTLLRLLAGLEAPTAGQVWVEDRFASDGPQILVPPHQRGISMVFQDLALWPTLTALANVTLGMANLRLPRTQCRAQALDSLKACQLDALAHRQPAALSIGQQQRVALARAMAVRPKLLFLDEPFSGLDLLLKDELFTEIQTVVVTHQSTLVLVTHDPMEAFSLCQTVLVLEDGVIAESGPGDRLLARPVSRTLSAFARRLSKGGPTPHAIRPANHGQIEANRT